MRVLEYFSTFDMEDLSHIHGLDVPGDLAVALDILKIKAKSRWCETPYMELRKALKARKNIILPTHEALIKKMGDITGVKPRYYDICPAGCQMYVGKFREATLCDAKTCRRPRCVFSSA